MLVVSVFAASNQHPVDIVAVIERHDSFDGPLW